MASSVHFFFCFLFTLFINRVCLAQISSILPSSWVLPVIKDDSNLQYITEIHYGTPLETTKLVVDLNGPFVWVDCASRLVSSSSTFKIPDHSIQCLKAKPHVKWQTSCLVSQTKPFQRPGTCQVSLQNNIKGTKYSEGELVQDIVALQSADKQKPHTRTKVHDFLISCAPSLLSNGLAHGAKGILGLGRFQVSFASQFATQTRKFTLCLSSSYGMMFFNDVSRDQNFIADILRELTYTPLIHSPGLESTSQNYIIHVKSIKINGKRISLNSSVLSNDKDGKGGTLLSSTVPYTTMERSIYTAFTQAYTKAAAFVGMVIVAPVKPFELCFSSKRIESSTLLRPNTPAIDLVLQSELVKWRIHGTNSMVKVSDEVMCLGFLDGGLMPSNAIVIGGHQLEDILLHVDMSTSMLGFSPSLLTRQTSCSNFSTALRLF